MAVAARLLEGLPSYGPMAIAFPTEWGQLGSEGVVVEIQTDVATWVGNFRPGHSKVNIAQVHPNNRDAIVVSGGDLWVVKPHEHSAQNILSGIDAAFEVTDPDGWIFSMDGLAIVRFGPDGIIWRTKRLSWDGFDQLRADHDAVTGMAYTPMDDRRPWYPFRVDVVTGRSTGGSYSDSDAERWEKLWTPADRNRHK